MAILKQSTAYTRMFKLVLSSDHITAATGKTATVNLSKAGAAFGAAGGTVSEVANGWYKIVLTTTDTNTLGDLAYYITASACDDTDFVDQVSARIIDDVQREIWSSASATVNLSATTVATVTTTTTATNVTTLSSGAISEASFATTAGSFAPLGIIDQGTAQSATGTTLVLRAAAAFANDELNGAWILITGGSAGVGQVRRITDYVSSTDTATVDTWTTTPSGTITYKVLAAPPIIDANVAQVGNVAGSLGVFPSGSITSSVLATGCIGADQIAADAIGASELASDAASEIGTAVWATAARTLTAATNITSTGGTTVPQTGDSYARIGANGVGLTSVALADATSDAVIADAVWNAATGSYGSAGTYGLLIETDLDAAISSRMATYTQPTGFLAATFPTTVASTTNITAGTITTATNVTTVNGLASGVITATAIADGAIDRATFAADTGLQTTRSNTAQSGGSTSITLDASASSTNDYYINQLVYITGGTGVGQSRFITAYNGTSKSATVNSAWATNPDNTSTFAIIPFDSIPGATAPTAAQVADAVWDEARSGHVASGSFGEGVIVQTNSDKTGYSLTQSFPSNFASLGINASGHISRVTLTDTLTTYTNNVVQTGDSYARIGATGSGLTSLASATNLAALDTKIGTPDGASVSADIAASFTVTEAIQDAVAAVQADLPTRITKNTALAGFTFFMVDSSDHVTGKTGLTITATRSLDGAAFASCTNSASEIGNGWYKIDLAAGDLNGNVVALRFTGTAADSRNITLITQPT